MKIIRTIIASVKLVLFASWIIVQIPIALVLSPFGRRVGTIQLTIFGIGLARILGVRVRARGEISRIRPLLIVANHISLFEFTALPRITWINYFGKSELRRYPLVGWLFHRLGIQFIDRNPATAATGVELLRAQMAAAPYPFAIFPEGTTTNGSYILPFKSSMFEFLRDMPNARVQPVTIRYLDLNGNKIPPDILANEYAYFANERQTQGPFAAREMSAFGTIWRALLRRGFIVDMHIHPVFDAAGLDRKEIAAALYNIVNEKFMELKNE